MVEKPILFNQLMMRALVAGRKTVTRRVVRYIPALGDPDQWCPRIGEPQFQRIVGDYRRHCPYGAPGDLLWVRETHAIVPATAYRHDPRVHHRVSADGYYWAIYRAGWERVSNGWRPSIHMPRWASRFTLRITKVGLERIQEITEEEAVVEGVEASSLCSAREGYAGLWDQINAKGGYSWAANPWTWVIRFALE